MLIAIIALVTVASSSAAIGVNPRLEKKQLSRADNARAARGLVKRSDLPGWKVDKPGPFDDEPSGMPGCDPDLSMFTITGRAHSAFQHPAGGTVDSEVDIFESTSDARGDFIASEAALTGRCLRAVFAKEGGKTVRLVSARKMPASSIGDRTTAFRAVISVKTPRARVSIYVDFLAFQQGRAIGEIFVSNPLRPLPHMLEALARFMAARSRR